MVFIAHVFRHEGRHDPEMGRQQRDLAGRRAITDNRDGRRHMTDVRAGGREMTDMRDGRRGRSGGVMALVALLAGVLGLAAMPSAQASGTGATTGTIAVNGSGFGHGVGMSQYGAYGQAKANPALTGAQIAQYYYTGSAVTSYPDNVPLKINVGHARTTMALRSTSLGTGGGGFTARVAGRRPGCCSWCETSPTGPTSASCVALPRRSSGRGSPRRWT